jgi:TPP-dependent pyruvate/acetoin dehydrogenase alpha subunit
MTGSRTTQTPSVAGKKGFSLINDEKFRQLYAALLQCEMLDQRLQSAPHSESYYEAWAGREASAAAIVACLCRGDTITPSPRGLLAIYLHSRSLTPARPSSAAAQLAAANQEAARHKLEKRGNVAIAFARVAESSSLHEVFAAAAKQSLPLFYVLEGGTPGPDHCAGIPIIRVDGSDTVALYRVAYESITRARDGGGPTIVECAPWPADAEPPDPLTKLEKYLAAKKLFRLHWKRQLQKKYSAAVEEAANSVRP